MFEDKTMVADTLAGINGELMRFGDMIPQTEIGRAACRERV